MTHCANLCTISDDSQLTTANKMNSGVILLESIMGRFVLGEPLTSGGQSTVVWSLDRFEQKKCILKLGESVLSEALLARSLNHPFITRPYDYGEDKQLGPFAVYEPVNGKTILEEWPLLSLSDQKRIVANIADTLAFLHKRDWLYNDF